MIKILKRLLPPITGMTLGFLCINEAFMYSGTTHYNRQDLVDNKELLRKVTRRHNIMKDFGVKNN